MHTTKEWNFALETLIESALMQGILSELTVIYVTFGHHSSFLIIAFFNCLLSTELDDLGFQTKLFSNFRSQYLHIVVKLDFLLAVRAIKVAKSYFLSCPSVFH